MDWKRIRQIKQIALFVLCIFLLAACKNGTVTATSTSPLAVASETPAAVVTATSTSFTPPTSDPDIPLVASVNGQGISLKDFQAELARAQEASESGLMIFTDDEVLQNLIDEVLLAQGANEADFMVDDEFIQARIDQLNLSEAALQDWLTENGYSQESFEQALERSIAAAWMRDQIIADVPSTAEQVHARQILLYNADEAKNIYGQLQSGTDFATLAAQYDPLASGELGWFPKGYLTVSDLDEPVFALQPGEYTEIIETALGFHIVQVVEKEAQYPLSPGAFQTLQVQAVEDWLVERRGQSDIQILLP